MRKSVRFVAIIALVLLPAVSFAGDRFDGKWLTTYTCPAKGNTEGFTWKFVSVVTGGAFYGERGTVREGEPGYFRVEGAIKDDGSAKLSAHGVVASRKYARGAFAHEGADYSFEIKAQFKETEGTGTRNEGLGVYGRPCTFEFVKQ
ncbi:MAG TPA: hypothetical protein VGE85_04470 [Terracidiphilus sp.]|jgi:hypothetical protein